MLLKDFDNPSDDELEAAFRELYYFIQPFSLLGKTLVWLVIRLMGDRLYALIAQRMHAERMQTLHQVSCGMHADFFKLNRERRKDVERRSRDWVKSEEVS